MRMRYRSVGFAAAFGLALAASACGPDSSSVGARPPCAAYHSASSGGLPAGVGFDPCGHFGAHFSSRYFLRSSMAPPPR